MTALPVQYGQHERIPAGTPCEVCGYTQGRPVMDHCHEHGWARGVLCVRCNHGMASVDKRRVPGRSVQDWEPDIPGLLRHAAKCHECPPIDPEDLSDLGAVRPPAVREGDGSTSVTGTEFRTNLARYLADASEGRTVYVMSHGYRIAALVPVSVADQATSGKR